MARDDETWKTWLSGLNGRRGAAFGKLIEQAIEKGRELEQQSSNPYRSGVALSEHGTLSSTGISAAAARGDL